MEVTTGRYNGVPREERLCKLCQSGLVEDELHFVLVCDYFVSVRQQFIPKYFYHKPSVSKFALLLKSENDVILRNLCKYIYHSCKKRDLFMGRNM